MAKVSEKRAVLFNRSKAFLKPHQKKTRGPLNSSLAGTLPLLPGVTLKDKVRFFVTSLTFQSYWVPSVWFQDVDQEETLVLSCVAVDIGSSPDIAALSGGATCCPHCLSPGCGL